MKRIIALVLALALGLTAEVTNADFTFGEPTNLGPTINSPYDEYDPSVSADSLSLYFMSDRPNGSGSNDLYVVRRETIYDDWGQAENLGPTVNGAALEYGPDISCDGLSLYFNAWPHSGDVDLLVTTRPTKSDPWGPPVNLGLPVNTSANESDPHISDDGLSLYFCDWGIRSGLRPGGMGDPDLWIATRAGVSDPWGTPVNLGPPVNTAYDEVSPDTSADGLVLFVTSDRPGGFGSWDIWFATRLTIDADWGEPVNLGPSVNSASLEGETSISHDGSTLYFHSNRPGGAGRADLWQVPIKPVVDLNGDGIVDAADMCIMVDHWGEDYSLCDIGPMPWGDGIIDVQDLIVLAEHLFEEFPPIKPVE